MAVHLDVNFTVATGSIQFDVTSVTANVEQLVTKNESIRTSLTKPTYSDIKTRDEYIFFSF